MKCPYNMNTCGHYAQGKCSLEEKNRKALCPQEVKPAPEFRPHPFQKKFMENMPEYNKMFMPTRPQDFMANAILRKSKIGDKIAIVSPGKWVILEVKEIHKGVESQ